MQVCASLCKSVQVSSRTGRTRRTTFLTQKKYIAVAVEQTPPDVHNNLPYGTAADTTINIYKGHSTSTYAT